MSKNVLDILSNLKKITPHVKMSDEILDVEAISTGLPGIDFILGVGGIPKGRVTEIYGKEGTGKTTLALYIIASAQKEDLICAFIDVEHAIDIGHMEACGVDPTKLIFSQPSHAEEALETINSMVKEGVDLIVLDSVAQMLPKSEEESDAGSAHMALIARLMSQAMRKLPVVLGKHNASVVFVNQLRANIGNRWEPDVTSGGAALKYAASVRIELRPAGKIAGPNGTWAGHTVRARVVKNKVGIPRKTATFDIRYSEPIQAESSLVELAKELGILKSRGGWMYLYDLDTGEQIKQVAHGIGNLLEELKTNKELYDEITTHVEKNKSVLKLGAFSDEGISDEEEKEASKHATP